MAAPARGVCLGWGEHMAAQVDTAVRRACAVALVLATIAVGSLANDLPVLTFTPVAQGLQRPVAITHAADGSGRLFITEQAGRVRILKAGTLLDPPFLDLSGAVSCCGERGLLSIAFPPGGAGSGRFYVNYTDLAGDTVVARYLIGPDPDRAVPTSEEVVLRVQQPYSNHNGGQLAFGPDGFLYIGMGDGGSAGDPQDRAQNPAELLGKLLRIDVESGAATYTVPPTNPFRTTPGYRPEIWAVGLRNPWRFSFDRQTGDLYIGDVGQNGHEEIDFQQASSPGGENYGWRLKEGSHCYAASPCAIPGLTDPAAEYDHGQGCSVSGGYVYRGAASPSLNGYYLYGDYCSGTIWALGPAVAGGAGVVLASTSYGISTFGEDEGGELYVADYFGGNVHRISAARAEADLGVSLALTPTVTTTTGRVTLRAVVGNGGPDRAASPGLVIDLGTSVRVESVDPGSGLCTLTGRLLVCAPAALEPGAEASVSVVWVASQPGTPGFTATVESEVYDPEPSNNQATAEATVLQGKIGVVRRRLFPH